MPLYRYLKSPPRIAYPLTAISLLTIHRNKLLVAFSYILITSGSILIGNALLPILSYELSTSRQITQSQTPRVFTQTIKPPSEVLAQAPPDLTNPATWFDSPTTLNPTTPSPIQYYTLSIPRLNIKDAIVKITKDANLDQSLIQYFGTSTPGNLGNPVIFGHSVLPQFFNPRNYLTIFSTLPTIKPTDTIYVNYDGVEYRYEVTDLRQVKPTDVSVLEQRYDRRELTLITCVPPGTYLRRLVVKAKLVENNK